MSPSGWRRPSKFFEVVFDCIFRRNAVDDVYEESIQGPSTRENHYVADETSDEERAAYDDRRNGVGALRVPQLQMMRNMQNQNMNRQAEQSILIGNGFRTDIQNDENGKCNNEEWYVFR